MLKLPKMNDELLSNFFKENRPLLLRLVVRRIRKAVKDNLQKIDIFSFDGNSSNEVIAACESSSYATLLQEAMDVFVKNEWYEDAVICRDLLKQIKCDDLNKNS